MKHIYSSLQKNWGKLVLLGVVSLVLAACVSGTSSNVVNATLTQSAYEGTVGQTTSVPVTFTTNTGTATNLSVNLSSLPSGWSQQNSQATFTCSSVTSSGTGCQLNLAYTPTAVTASMTLSLSYSYTASDGTAKSGTVDINYSATNTLFAYITDQTTAVGNGKVTLCSISSMGALTGCQYTGSNFTNPNGIAINTTSGVTYAYVLNSSGLGPHSTITQCTVNTSSGLLSDCSVTTTLTSTGAVVDGINFATFNGTTYAYLAANDDDYQCSINPSTGAIIDSSCTAQTADQIFDANSIIFANGGSNTYAYTSSFSGPGIFQCRVKTTNGAFNTPCTLVNIPFGGSFGPITSGIDIAAAQNGNTYAYVPNSDGNIFQCTLTNGDFESSTCPSLTNFGAGVTHPWAIGIETVNGSNYVFVVDSTDSKVSSCPIQSDGTFGTCNVSSGNSGAFDSPEAITFLSP